jgi:hypothetical protein
MKNREDLTQSYVERLVDGMGERELVRYTTDSLLEQFDRYSDVHLEEEIMKFYPELLDEPLAILEETRQLRRITKARI